MLPGRDVGNDASGNGQRVSVIHGEVVRDAGDTRVNVSAAELFSSDIFARSGFDQRRSADEDRPSAFDDDGFIAHRWHIRPASRPRAHHYCYLRNAFGRKIGLIEENSTEVFAVRKDICLER